ncbi:VUT family protein [Limibaculum sp. FT325]|uniref:VUT family protein n=1 Tax=Thermohalobaculum sediminis TaxID=2939436 RepID=UPI0020C0B52B|nr:VUT family protein [Limibaculum sediminis]MCL5775856.1 VUT family protein [Limibaculum sediminis]
MGAQARGILTGVVAMMVIVTASNVLVQYPFNDWLTWGAFTYPMAFLVTDLSNRYLGAAGARRVVLAGFVLAVALSVWLATPRIAVASGTAFLCAQLLDVAVFDRLRAGSWWRAPLVSSFFGSALDTALFFSMAFAPAFGFLGANEDWALAPVPLLGMGAPVALWVSLAVGDFGVKLALALLALVPFRAAIALAGPGVRGRPRGA